MNNDLLGFKQEFEKLSTSMEDGAKGVAIGALVGAVLAGLSTEMLEKLISRNKDLAIITGAMMGAGGLGSAGYVLGGENNVVQPAQAPFVGDVKVLH